MFGYFDPAYLLLVMLPALVLGGLAQFFVQNAFSKWGQTRNGSAVTGPEAAQQIMRTAGLKVRLELTPGRMSDHYDPTSHTVRMSPEVAERPSVAAMAIVAHELGHAQQHQDGSALISLRNFLVPAVQMSPIVSYGLIMAGLVLNLTGLAWIGVAFFAVTVFFMVLTLPVEIDASLRGLKLLEQSGLMRAAHDRSGSRQILTAAALTYVAAAVTAILQLLYYVNLISRSRN
jgi:Zn-dependent membrane protease YugP